MEKYLFVISKDFEKLGAATRAVQFAIIAAEKGLHGEDMGPPFSFPVSN